MLNLVTVAEMGDVTVRTTDNRGFTPEELVDQVVDRIISVGSESHPAIRDQALAFRQFIRGTVLHGMQRAVQSDRTTIAARLRDAGHAELTELLKG